MDFTVIIFIIIYSSIIGLIIIANNYFHFFKNDISSSWLLLCLIILAIILVAPIMALSEYLVTKIKYRKKKTLTPKKEQVVRKVIDREPIDFSQLNKVFHYLRLMFNNKIFRRLFYLGLGGLVVYFAVGFISLVQVENFIIEKFYYLKDFFTAYSIDSYFAKFYQFLSRFLNYEQVAFVKENILAIGVIISLVLIYIQSIIFIRRRKILLLFWRAQLYNESLIKIGLSIVFIAFAGVVFLKMKRGFWFTTLFFPLYLIRYFFDVNEDIGQVIIITIIILYGFIAMKIFSGWFIDVLKSIAGNYARCPYCGNSIKVVENWQCDKCKKFQGEERLIKQYCKECKIGRLRTVFCEHCHNEIRLYI